MAIPTKIKLDDFYDTVKEIANNKGLICKPYKGGKASAICFEFFKQNKTEPFYVFCIHENKKEKVIYSDDLKKACKALSVTKKEFEDFIKAKQ